MFGLLDPYKKTREKCRKLIFEAKSLGLSNSAIDEANEYLEFNEFGLAFDQLIQQINDQNIPITKDFYFNIVELASMMELPEKEYFFIKRLLQDI